MKTYAPESPRRANHIRVPAFLPVPLRTRADGWTPQRQAAFLVALTRTGSVSAAAREIGMARESAYQLRRHPQGGSFAAAWNAALNLGEPVRKLTGEERFRAALEGRIKPVVWHGKCVGTEQKVDNSAFLGLFKRLTRKPMGKAR